MIGWQVWLIIAGICAIIEIGTIGFLFIWFAVAALVSCIFSLFISNVIIQTAIFVIVSIILILLTKPLTQKFTKNDNHITNINRIIGKTGIVKKEITPISNGLISLNGDLWTAVLDVHYKETIPVDSTVEILDIDGVKVIVKPLKISSKVN